MSASFGSVGLFRSSSRRHAVLIIVALGIQRVEAVGDLVLVTQPITVGVRKARVGMVRVDFRAVLQAVESASGFFGLRQGYCAFKVTVVPVGQAVVVGVRLVVRATSGLPGHAVPATRTYHSSPSLTPPSSVSAVLAQGQMAIDARRAFLAVVETLVVGIRLAGHSTACRTGPAPGRKPAPSVSLSLSEPGRPGSVPYSLDSSLRPRLAVPVGVLAARIALDAGVFGDRTGFVPVPPSRYVADRGAV